MPLPTLPADAWFRISTSLDPESLSSLSQVNKSLNAVATDEYNFRRHLGPEQDKSIHPAQLYRRQRALCYPPNASASFQLSPSIGVVGTVQDSVLLFDGVKKSIIVFPSCITIDADVLLGEVERDVLRRFNKYHIRNKAVVLPDGRVALLNNAARNRLVLFDLGNGEAEVFQIERAATALCKRITDMEFVAVAGEDGEWLIYYTDANYLALFDWRNGETVRQIYVGSEGVKCWMAECPSIDGMSIVGLLSEDSDGPMLKISAEGFDGVEETFFLDPEYCIKSVLRSADKATNVLITLIGRWRDEVTEFIAYREEVNDIKKWSGILKMGPWPVLRENGRVIAERGRSIGWYFAHNGGEAHLYIVLKDDCTTEITHVPELVSDTYFRSRTIWLRRNRENTVALVRGWIGDMSLDAHSFVHFAMQMVNDGEDGKQILLKRWEDAGETIWCVVADHFILAIDKEGRIIVHHFDRFCNGGQGIYACPELFSLPEDCSAGIKCMNMHEEDTTWDACTS